MKIVMDDGGGIALCVWRDKYAHLYDDPSQVGDDIIALMDGATCERWDNNEWGTGITTSDSGCRTYCGTPMQIIKDVIADYDCDNSYGHNHDGLAAALRVTA